MADEACPMLFCPGAVSVPGIAGRRTAVMHRPAVMCRPVFFEHLVHQVASPEPYHCVRVFGVQAFHKIGAVKVS